MRAEGARPALDLLDRIAALDPRVRRDGHRYAHGIGIAALSSPDRVSAVFASCTPGWQSGCYHGVIQSYFLPPPQLAAAELGTASVDALNAGPGAAKAAIPGCCSSAPTGSATASPCSTVTICRGRSPRPTC